MGRNVAVNLFRIYPCLLPVPAFPEVRSEYHFFKLVAFPINWANKIAPEAACRTYNKEHAS